MAMMVARQRAAHQMLAMIWENASMKRSRSPASCCSYPRVRCLICRCLISPSAAGCASPNSRPISPGCRQQLFAMKNGLRQATTRVHRRSILSRARARSRRSDVSQNQSSRSCGMRDCSRLSCSSSSSSHGSEGSGGWSLFTCRHWDEQCPRLCRMRTADYPAAKCRSRKDSRGNKG